MTRTMAPREQAKTAPGSRNGEPRWVDEKRGLVDREVFLSDEICRLEFARIFDRSWMFLAHESEIPAPGAYVTRMLGSAPVIVVRDRGGAVRVLLNSCRHRGTKLCRADAGNAQRLVCGYHGWAYELNGRLITTTFDRHFPRETDFAALGLVAAPMIACYKGLIFASWADDVPPLERFLGDFRFYLDAFFARTPGGMEVLAPPHRWRVGANWKFGALNFIGDGQHVVTTHAGPLTLDPRRSAATGLVKISAESFQVFTDGGHGATFNYLAQGLPDWAYETYAAALKPLYSAALAPAQLALIHHLRVVVGTVFPNLSFIESEAGQGEKALVMRQWHPISGTETEVLSWVLAEREAAAEYKANVLAKGFRNFGAAGVFEQDDMALWASATAASDNPVAARFPLGFQTGVPYLDKPETRPGCPGQVFRSPDTEVAQFAFMRHWDRVMNEAG